MTERAVCRETRTYGSKGDLRKSSSDCWLLASALPNPLLPNESCNLGSINVAKMVKNEDKGWGVDWKRLQDVIVTAVRLLDNVIEANNYPLPQIEEITRQNRKIGLGVMGFADLLLRLGIAYDSVDGVEFGQKLMRFIREKAREASQALALERGPFPNYPQSIYAEHNKPMRNATVTTIAPTGTISIIANCSSGVEPLFALAFTRNVMDDDKLIEVNPVFEAILRERELYSDALMQRVAQAGSVRDVSEIPEDLRRVCVTAHDIAPEWHIKMQAAFQEHTDNAVSKTVNFPSTAAKDDIADVYRLAFELGCKGVTVYRSGSREGEVLTVGDKGAKTPKAGTHQPRKRPPITRGQTERVKTGCGTLYVTINEDDQGICEVFTTIGKAGGCAGSFSEATARLISTSLRSGVELAQVARQLRGIRCPHPVWQNGKLVLSCPDAIAQVFDRYLGTPSDQGGPAPAGGLCPECGGQLRYESGCTTCADCGFSRC